MTVITLPRGVHAHMLEQARASPEHEVCGLLGKPAGAHSVSCYPVTNIAADPRQHFEMDPRGQIDAFKHMRARGEQLWAIYHSHPRGPAEPSATDIRRMSYPDALYLIISAADTPPVRAWCWRADRPLEVPLRTR